MKKNTKQLIVELSKEFDDKNGYVTCEISIHKDKIDELNTFVKKNTNIKLGKWITMECETCVKYNGDGYVHASIEKYDTITKMEKASNHIKTLD
jgi:hypothetical protein